MPDNDFFTGYDHISYATKDTDATVAILTALGFVLKNYKEGQDDYDVYVTKMVSSAGDVAEIVEPRSEASAVSEILRKLQQQTVVYHTCFRTTDFDAAHAALKRAGAVSIFKPTTVQVALTEEHRTFQYSHMYHPFLGVFEVTGPRKE